MARDVGEEREGGVPEEERGAHESVAVTALAPRADEDGARARERRENCADRHQRPPRVDARRRGRKCDDPAQEGQVVQRERHEHRADQPDLLGAAPLERVAEEARQQTPRSRRGRRGGRRRRRHGVAERPRDLVHAQRSADPLHGDLAARAAGDGVADEGEGRMAEDDAARRALLLEPRGDVHLPADRRVVHPPGGAEVAEAHHAGVDAHAEREVASDARRAPRRGERRDARPEGLRHLYRADRRLARLAALHPEEHQRRVAHELVDGAAEARRQLGHGREVIVEDAGERRVVERVRDAGEVGQVAEDDRQLAALVDAGRLGQRAVDDARGELRCDVPPDELVRVLELGLGPREPLLALAPAVHHPVEDGHGEPEGGERRAADADEPPGRQVPVRERRHGEHGRVRDQTRLLGDRRHEHRAGERPEPHLERTAVDEEEAGGDAAGRGGARDRVRA